MHCAAISATFPAAGHAERLDGLAPPDASDGGKA
jgi:hypothetical protein